MAEWAVYEALTETGAELNVYCDKVSGYVEELESCIATCVNIMQSDKNGLIIAKNAATIAKAYEEVIEYARKLAVYCEEEANAVKKYENSLQE